MVTVLWTVVDERKPNDYLIQAVIMGKEIKMLTKIIVSSYEILIEIALWFFLIGCLVFGWNAGKHSGNAFLSSIGALIVGFFFAVIFFGAFLVLSDIRKSVRALEARHNS